MNYIMDARVTGKSRRDWSAVLQPRFGDTIRCEHRHKTLGAATECLALMVVEFEEHRWRSAAQTEKTWARELLGVGA